MNNSECKRIIGGIFLSSNDAQELNINTSFFAQEQSNYVFLNYLSSFKIISQIIESLKLVSENKVNNINKVVNKYYKYSKSNELEHMALNFDENNNLTELIKKQVEELQGKLNSLSSNGLFNITDNNFGLIELAKFSKNFTNNIFAVIKINPDENKIGNLLTTS